MKPYRALGATFLSFGLATLLVVAGSGAHAQEGEIDGAAIFAGTCAACHQADGQGLPAAFPPLAGHVGELFAAEDGPRYLASVVLFGLEGQITVNGEVFDGVMPSFFRFSDEEIAAVIDHVMTAWGDAESLPEEYVPLAPADVKAARGSALSAQLVHDRRPQLGEVSSAVDAADLVEASFTAAQVEGIEATYDRLCEDCHGDDLTGGLIGGPPLAGFVFRQKWGGRSLAALYQFMSTQMPQGNPGSLSPQQYADLLALILSHNQHTAGEEPLTPDIERLGGLTVRTN